ncbi:MAG: DUF4350 domain-containing protein [Chloroflexi bacterium]|nr:DUF4350 domain-containing protein [Chloroflexota bacterium]
MIRLLLRHRAPLMLALLLLGGAVAAQSAAGCDQRSLGGRLLSSRDACPAGALALALWLDQLGYQVGRMEGLAASPDESTELLFVLRPTRRFDRAEARATLDWVRRGGVLVYVPSMLPGEGAAPGLPSDGLADELALALRFGPMVERVAPSFPFFSAPPGSRFVVQSSSGLELRDDTWLPLMGDGGRVLAAARLLGRGRVYAAASEALFTNQGLGEDDNATFLLNVLARHPTLRAVAFDERHHGIIEPPDLAGVVRSSPWGWALMYAAAVSFGFLVWGGRRFGPALVPERTPRRSSGEYVTAFAGLLQRARAADWAQAQYTHLLRRHLARTLGVRADLPAADLARRLAERWPIDSAGLAERLAALDRPRLGERGLLVHVRALEQMLRVLRGGDGETRGPSTSSGRAGMSKGWRRH